METDDDDADTADNDDTALDAAPAHITDTETERTPVDKLRPDQLYSLLQGIRERRLRAIQILRKARKVEAEINEATSRSRYLKQISIADKELAKLDTLIDKLESRISKLQVMALELTGSIDTFKD